MSPIFHFTQKDKIRFLLTDIDDTITNDGKLLPEAYEAMWLLHRAGIAVVPITGRPAGWCEMIARFWPVAGVVGENGSCYFRHVQDHMIRSFWLDEQQQKASRQRLTEIGDQILQQVPRAKISSDQFCRLFDLAIDYCEDIHPPLSSDAVQKIVDVFQKNGARVKVSSIHVNGWFGEFDKLAMTIRFLSEQFSIDADQAKKICVFVGDSPNDEPMFKFFPHSFGVANIAMFATQMTNLPAYICTGQGGHGLRELAEFLTS